MLPYLHMYAFSYKYKLFMYFSSPHFLPLILLASSMRNVIKVAADGQAGVGLLDGVFLRVENRAFKAVD